MFLTLIAACQSRQSVDFNTQIKPIINKKCISCHGGVKQSAGFSLLFQQEALGNTDEGTPAIIPGNANKSRIIQRFHENDPQLRMPFENPPLSKEEIDLFTKWINQGANWGTHWAYISPEKSEIPKVGKSFDRMGFLKNPIDNFIAAQLEDKKISSKWKSR
jgi:hypothetical protein